MGYVEYLADMEVFYMKTNDKVYEQNWFMWLMLIFITPVGIFLMWKYKKFNQKVRIILSSLFGAYFIFMMIATQIDEAKIKENQKKEAIKIEAQKKAEAEKKKAEAEKKKQEELLKPSEFEGITVGQENKLREFIMPEAKKSIKKEGTFYDNWKMFKEGNLYTLMFSYKTKERNVEVENKFVATLNWDGSSGNFKLRRINSNPVIVLSTSHFSTLVKIAKDAVKANLKAPSTAKFPGTVLQSDEWKFGATFKGTNEGYVLYQVQSYVDAQNSFGAMIRSNFNVVIVINWDTDQYIIKSVRIN